MRATAFTVRSCLYKYAYVWIVDPYIRMGVLHKNYLHVISYEL
jgi:hypothetical protein